MRKIFWALMVIAFVGMNGCSTRNILMNPVDAKVMNTSLSNKEAAIVFFTPAIFGSGSAWSVYEVEESGTLKFITFAAQGAKTLHKTTAGKHRYVLAPGNIMDAEFSPGKTYYAYLSDITPAAVDVLNFILGGPIMVAFSSGHHQAALTPVTASDLSSEKFKKDFAGCVWSETKPSRAQQGYDPDRIKKWYSKLLQDDPNIKDKILKILPGDGVAVPIQ